MEEEKKEEGSNKEGEGEKQQQKNHEGKPEADAEAKEEKTSTIKEEADKEQAQKAGEDDKVVLKVDMHCEACARKVVRALHGFQGVEEVRADYKAGRVVVKGKGATADPVRVSQRIQKKTGRRNVEIISPLPKPPAEPPKEEPPKQDKKEQEPPVAITVVLKVQMHCEACAQVMQKRIRKVKGVELVTADIVNNEVTVKGNMDPDKLVSDVYKRTRKHVLLVKNEEIKKEEKKDEEKPEEKKQVAEEEQSKEEDEAKADIKRAEHWPPRNYMDYAYAPQMFSDDNPNACSVM